MIDFNYTLFIQFANFLILLILLNIFLFKPVLKALNKRDGTIGSLFGKSSTIKEELGELEKSYEEKVKERKRPILESKDAMLSEAHTSSMKIIEKTRAELSDELARLRAEIEQESRKVYDSMESEVKRLSADVAQKILKRSV
ncbi:MAG TPA: ATP synthase F0 subunit B [Syntrophorhabdaceae bacterium]|nr:ATP synthase F0 subunit B [Syntrophorhabdaceae bacterium]MDI9561409.1 ATP synthase F0 subunit B [Pseudomonadota bacterium]MBV6506629.1 ATP synthase subunit b' [Syntrophorhabdaceae bacterium]HNQ62526.1 ATP synthase F0 subunit B [Syntrophorhabdaceae bacterium]HNZ58720.1 ATP synthase F0 subunit B [Syntrophorhabdaceae bacterium]